MFQSYETSLDLIDCVRNLIPIIEKRDRNLADQLRRAANSVVLNLAEGARHFDGNRRKHYAIAHGSAFEVKGAIDVAKRWRIIDDAPRTYATLDRLLGLLWGLTRPRVRETPAQRE